MPYQSTPGVEDDETCLYMRCDRRVKLYELVAQFMEQHEHKKAKRNAAKRRANGRKKQKKHQEPSRNGVLAS